MSCLIYTFKRFPKLKRVVLSLDGTLRARSNTLSLAYSDALLSARGDISAEEYGVRQLKTVLFAAAQANIRLDDLAVGEISHKFLRLAEGERGRISKVMESLRSLYLVVQQPKLTNGFFEYSIQMSYLNNEHGLLNEFIESASNLRVLRLNFPRGIYRYRYPFRYIIGSTTLPQLRWIWLKNVMASSVELISFLKRHKELMYIRLDKFVLCPGHFEDTLRELSQSLPKLRRFEFRGRTIGERLIDRDYEWIGCPDEVGWCQHSRCHALDNYIRNGGVMPLTEEDIATHIPFPTYKGKPGQGPGGEVDYAEDRLAAARTDADEEGEGTEWRKGWV